MKRGNKISNNISKKGEDQLMVGHPFFLKLMIWQILETKRYSLPDVWSRNLKDNDLKLLLMSLFL